MIIKDNTYYFPHVIEQQSYISDIEEIPEIQEKKELTAMKTNKKRLRSRIKIGYENGKPLYKWASAYSKKELKLEAERIKQEYSAQAIQQNSTLNTVSPIFETYALEWFELYKKPSLRASSKAMYQNILKAHLLPAFGSLPLNSINANDLQRFILGFSSASKSLVDKILMVLRQIFNAALDDELIRKNPVNKLKPPEGVTNERMPLSMEAATQLIQQASRVENGLLPLLMLCTGLRRGEALALTWEDIGADTLEVKRALNYENNSKAVISDTKTKAALRKIPLTQPLLSLLETKRQPKGFVFGSDNPLPYSSYKRIWTRLQKDIPALNGVSAHRLRHSYLMLLRRAGVDAATQQYLMGHADYETTANHYTHIDRADIKDAQALLASLLPQYLPQAL